MLDLTKRLSNAFFPLFGVMLVLGACGSSAPPAYAEVAPAYLVPGDNVPTPSGEVILALSGDIGVSNSGANLNFDMNMLERLGTVEYTIADPWQGHENVTYQGVLLSRLLEFAEASDSATTVHMVALDDYAIDLSIEDINRWPILVATQKNGSYMSIENSGPSQIVFPYHAFPEIDEATYKVLTIWNLRDMEVR